MSYTAKDERQMLLETLRYTGNLLGLGKEIGETYCLQFDDRGYGLQGESFDAGAAIAAIADKASDEQLLDYFSRLGLKGHLFQGRFYTLKDGRLMLGSEWPSLRAGLSDLLAKYGDELPVVLETCYRVNVDMDRKRKNYLYMESLARDMGAKSFRRILTDLELTGLVIRYKGDIHLSTEIISLVKDFIDENKARRELTLPESDGGSSRVELPNDLFQDIIGHDEVKELLQVCLLAPKPVHVLLSGPPALAKSLFLWELERAIGDRACWVLGSSASRAGLLEVLLQRRPWLALIDELDKLDREDQAALLSVLEGGRLNRTKAGKTADQVIDIRVVAACNERRRLAPELISRFAVKRLYAYTPEEYRQVVIGVLVRREGCAPEAAAEIAARLVGRTQDVRDAIRVARLCPQLGIGGAVRLLLGEHGPVAPPEAPVR